MAKEDDWAAQTRLLRPFWAYANPVHLQADSQRFRQIADPAYSNYGIEAATPQPAHAVLDSKMSEAVWVALMCSYVDEDSHRSQAQNTPETIQGLSPLEAALRGTICVSFITIMHDESQVH